MTTKPQVLQIEPLKELTFTGRLQVEKSESSVQFCYFRSFYSNCLQLHKAEQPLSRDSGLQDQVDSSQEVLFKILSNRLHFT